MAGLIVLQVKRRVQKGEVGEQPLGADPAGQLEQVVVRVAGVVVDPLFDLEDVDGEDGGLAVSKARLLGQQHVPDDHPALGGGVGAVVEGAERRLRARAGVHGVQVVDQRLHGLVGGAVRLLLGVGAGKLLHLVDEVRVQALGRQQLLLPAEVVFAAAELRVQALLGQGVHGLALHGLVVLAVALHQLQAADDVVAVALAEGLLDARGQAVVEVDDGLPAVLVVLVALYGDGRQRRIAPDGFRLPKVPVAGVKPALKQLPQLDLGAGGGPSVKIQVVDMHPSFPVQPGGLRVDHGLQIVFLGRVGPVLQHGAHGRVPVDVGVVPL